MLNLHISFSFYAAAVLVGAVLLRTLHASRRAALLRAKALQPSVALRAGTLR